VPAAPGFYTVPGTGLDTKNQEAQVACQPGQYCSDGVAAPCPAGTYGATTALPSAACSGPCAAGYVCPVASTTPTHTPCGGIGVYCPEGSAIGVPAAPGEFTEGPSPATRTGVLPCPSGSYCVGGMRLPCEGGTFGCADRLSSASCNGPCTAGFFCPAGSVSSQQATCGGNASSPNAASYFCPLGAAAALRVGAGNYSTGSADDAPHRRTGQAVCPPGRYCAGGVSVRAPVCDMRACACVRVYLFAWKQVLPFANAGSSKMCVTRIAQLPCPAGWFGAVPAEASPTCSGLCAPGYECPAGSTSSTSSVCPAGYFCTGGARQPCPAGRYSDAEGSTSADACAACPAGTYSEAPAATAESTCVECAPFENSTEGAHACWLGVVSAVAFNPAPVTPGFSVGDVVVLTFSAPTNASATVVFTPSIGATSRSWRAGGRELWITVSSVEGVNASAVDVATGSLSVSVAGVFSASGASPPAPVAVVTVGGTWGVPTPPAIVDVTVFDGGRNVGPGTGDTLVITFDQAVRPVDAVQSADVLASLLTFLPAFPAGVVATGAWRASLTLVVSLAVADGTFDNWAAWNVGTLSVSVRAAANLTTASGESRASNSSAIVRGGSWGDAPAVALSPKSSTAAMLTLSPPTTASSYKVTTYAVQWGTDPAFAGVVAVPATLAGVQAWATSATSLRSMVDDNGNVIAHLALLSSRGPGSAVDTAVVEQSAPASTLPSVLLFEIPRLATSTEYFFRGLCNGPGDGMGPVVLSSPVSITPQPPRVVLLTAPNTGLPTAGGIFVSVAGEHLGGADSTVLLVLSSAELGSFVSGACDVTAPGIRVRCVSPPGAGTGLLMSLSVDGMISPPFANGTLSYLPPSINELHAVDGEGVSGDGVPTMGGGVVVISGSNFGPAELGPLSLGDVTYSPAALSVALGGSVVFPAQDCAITRSHTELTCRMGSGVGGGLQWSVTIAGQTAATVRSSYRAPVVRSVGLLLDTGVVSFSPEVLTALVTQGGQKLVRASFYFSLAHPQQRTCCFDACRAACLMLRFCCELVRSPMWPQVFTGDYFGPSGHSLPVVAEGRQQQGGGLVRSTACTVVGAGHTTAHCTSPPGTGTGYSWTLTVAGQQSVPSVQATSYGPPAVTAVTVSGLGSTEGGPLSVPTAGGATVTLLGTNFGGDASRIYLLCNGDAVSGVVAEHTRLTFPSPVGQGATVRVSLTVAGQVAEDMPLLRYAAPRITGVRLDWSNSSRSLLDCSVVDSDGRPALDSEQEEAAVVVLRGVNFGVGTATEVTIGGVVCRLLAPVQHAEVVCETPMCEGA
jgi:hypothetical protein